MSIKYTKNDFLHRFLEKRNLPPVYRELKNSFTGRKVYASNATLDAKQYGLLQIYDFPGYLNPTVNHSSKQWKLNEIDTYKGSMIVLKDYADLNDYLKTKFSAKRRAQFRNYEKRLNVSFDIEYKIYHGEISEKEYKFLFGTLKDMILRRFSQRGETNDDMQNWEVYEKIGLPLINAKQAVLFVIFNRNEPISISFQIILDKIAYGYLKSYDIDYAKFSLGFVDFVFQLRWYFKNGFEIFDLLKGNYPYKNKIVDGKYNFKIHVIYNSKSKKTSLSALFLTFRVRLFYGTVDFLRVLKIDFFYRRLQQIRANRHSLVNGTFQSEAVQSIQTYPFDQDLESMHDTIQVNPETSEYAFLKRHVFDFLYNSSEYYGDIKIFELKHKSNTFIFKGKKEARKVIISR